MRLLQRDSDGILTLVSVSDSEPPPFAILSHTWGQEHDEVSFQDIQHHASGREERSNGPPAYQKKLGWRKVEFCLTQAKRDNLHFVWIDTCCINKDSQTELGKAINWMYRWYAASQKCYVYLTDVAHNDLGENWRPAFQASRWFTRGWTLQELIAPMIVEFYAKNGVYLGTKTELASVIHAITTIPETLLLGEDLSRFDVQTRFDWGLKRITKEPEDRVYSMFGVLDVSFPPNYGEGERMALRRLRAALLEAYSERLLVLDFHEEQQDPDRIRNILYIKPINKTEPAAETVWVKRVLASLQFPQKDLRRSNITPQTATTCDWVFTHPLYSSWLERSDISSCGLLWIKGNPGAGKSTLMKFIDTSLVAMQTSNEVIISFYFNARGSRLEKTVEGMYRSLLHQLLGLIDHKDVEKLARAMLPYPVPAVDSEWPIRTLQLYFSAIANTLQNRKLIIFVDALDECKDYEIRDTLIFLEDLGHSANENGGFVLMCFASRYYPSIVLSPALEIRLEEEIGHADDVAKYVTKSLRIGEAENAASIKIALLRRAKGVFIWAVLVTRILNNDYLSGRIWGMKERLESMPLDMRALFSEIVNQDDILTSELLLSLQWVLYASRPMTGQEFYRAMWAGSGSTIPDEGIVSEIDVRRYVSSCSKGLVELTYGTFPTVQFIHETVREFLLKDGGLAQVEARGADFRGSSHERVCQICKECLDKELAGWEEYRLQTDRSDHLSAESYRKRRVRKNAFFAYAAESIMYHAELAAPEMTVEYFTSAYGLEFWLRLHVFQQFDRSFQLTPDDNLIHFFVRNEAPNLVEKSLESSLATVDEGDLWSNRSPLLLACALGNFKVVPILLRCGADVDLADDDGITALMKAVSNDAPIDLIEALVVRSRNRRAIASTSAGHSALSYAVRDKKHEVIRLLLKHDPELSEEPTPDEKEFVRVVEWRAKNADDTLTIEILLEHGFFLNSDSSSEDSDYATGSEGEAEDDPDTVGRNSTAPDAIPWSSAPVFDPIEIARPGWDLRRKSLPVLDPSATRGPVVTEDVKRILQTDRFTSSQAVDLASITSGATQGHFRRKPVRAEAKSTDRPHSTPSGVSADNQKQKESKPSKTRSKFSRWVGRFTGHS